MKSGLRDRNNNPPVFHRHRDRSMVSMKSGLRDRNNMIMLGIASANQDKSKLCPVFETGTMGPVCFVAGADVAVSMESGLRDRNNAATPCHVLDG